MRYIAQDDPGAAIRFGNHILDRTELLADFPELGTPYRNRASVRRILCKPYLIYYRIRSAEQIIEILDYWHTAHREPSI